MQGFMASANSIADHFGCVVVPITILGTRAKGAVEEALNSAANSDNAILSQSFSARASAPIST